MEQVKHSVGAEKKSRSGALKEKSAILETAVHAVIEKKGKNIISLDLKNINEAVADYFILCEANNPLQIRAICDNVEEELRLKHGEKPYRIQFGDGWTLLDYINIVVHIFNAEERKFYDLEGLWSDGKRTEYNAD